MAIESYDQIMARLNNPYGYAPMQPQEPAATDFTNFVINYLNDPNPKGGMFRLQDEIDERKLKSKQEDAAKAAQAAGGMFVPASGGGSGSDSKNVELTPEQIAFLENETLDQRGERLKRDWLGLKPIAGMLLDPLGTFLTYPKQEPAPVSIATGKTPAQIAFEQRQLEMDALIAQQQQAAAEEAAAAQAAAARAYVSQPYYQTQDSSSYSDYAGAGQAQMDRSLQSQSDYYG